MDDMKTFGDKHGGSRSETDQIENRGDREHAEPNVFSAMFAAVFAGSVFLLRTLRRI